MSIFRVVSLGMFLAAWGIAGNAAVIHNEAVDGDLSNSEASPTLFGGLSNGSNQVAGTVGGSSDQYDVFQFSIGTGGSLDALILDAFVLAGGNTSTGFNLDFAPFDFSGMIISIAVTPSLVGQDLLVVGGAGPVGPGDYVMSLREFTGYPGQAYQMDFQVSGVPEPSTVGLMALGLAGVGFVRRRRSLRLARRKL